MAKLKNLFKGLIDEVSEKAQSNTTIKGGIDQIKKTVDSLPRNLVDGMKVAKEQWTGFNENNTEKYAKYINEALKIIPMLKEVGYDTEQFLVHITLPPSVEVHLNEIKTIEKEELEEIKEKYKENYIFVKTVEALYQAALLQKMINSEALQPKGVQILLGVPPRVSLVYQPKEVSEETFDIAKTSNI
jgi:hypothetical protein